MNVSCTRRFEFDAAHRIVSHGGKCRHLHGHRYCAEITFTAPELGDDGMVVDFGIIKQYAGEWIDAYFDHGSILSEKDKVLIDLCDSNEWKVYIMQGEPTAENIAKELFHRLSKLICSDNIFVGLRLTHLRLYETPNCWADVTEV